MEAFIDNAKAFCGSQKSYAEALDTLTNEEQEYLEIKWSQTQFATQRKFEGINSAKHLAVALNDCRERTTAWSVKLNVPDEIVKSRPGSPQGSKAVERHRNSCSF